MLKEEKKSLRKAVGLKREELSKEYMKKASEQITNAVLESDIYKNSKCIFIFISMEREPDTKKIIEEAWRDGKTVCVPKCTAKGQMKPVIIRSFFELNKGAYGIMEPKGEMNEADEALIDLSFIPCISANEKGQRIGHGGGYYDIFLERSKSVKLCICFKLLSVSNIPIGEKDQLMDYLVTEDGLFKCHAK